MKPKIRARQKPIEFLPAWALCCEEIIEKTKATRNMEEILVLDGANFSASVSCPYCGNMMHDVACMRESQGKRRAVMIELYDLDEGA